MSFNIGFLTDETCLGHFLTLLCPYSIFTDLLSRDLLFLNRVANYTLLYQLVKGFGVPISANFQISFFAISLLFLQAPVSSPQAGGVYHLIIILQGIL